MSDAVGQSNTERFTGIADVYEHARPAMPAEAVDIIRRYLKREPETVVDLGCGTGLSTEAWRSRCGRAVGVEPNADMLSVARRKEGGGVSFRMGVADHTGLPDACADVICCSQSFHWMEPVKTLAEADRLLRQGGVFAAVDCDWPPVCGLREEQAYEELFTRVGEIERQIPSIGGRYHAWDKSHHLANIRASGIFRYSREIVFAHDETCDGARWVGIAMSQGGLQNILKTNPDLILPALEKFKRAAAESFGGEAIDITFCYRMRLGIK